jgi:predicted nucleic acid-binding protein
MPDVLVDSSVIIDHLRGRPQATSYLANLESSGALATHAVVVAEVLSGARDSREQRDIDQLFQHFSLLTVSEADSRDSLTLLRQFRLSHGVGWLDCLIASTAIRLAVPVANLNIKHFAVFPGLRVFAPY